LQQNKLKAKKSVNPMPNNLDGVMSQRVVE